MRKTKRIQWYCGLAEQGPKVNTLGWQGASEDPHAINSNLITRQQGETGKTTRDNGVETKENAALRFRQDNCWMKGSSWLYLIKQMLLGGREGEADGCK